MNNIFSIIKSVQKITNKWFKFKNGYSGVIGINEISLEFKNYVFLNNVIFRNFFSNQPLSSFSKLLRIECKRSNYYRGYYREDYCAFSLFPIFLQMQMEALKENCFYMPNSVKVQKRGLGLTLHKIPIEVVLSKKKPQKHILSHHKLMCFKFCDNFNINNINFITSKILCLTNSPEDYGKLFLNLGFRHEGCKEKRIHCLVNNYKEFEIREVIPTYNEMDLKLLFLEIDKLNSILIKDNEKLLHKVIREFYKEMESLSNFIE